MVPTPAAALKALNPVDYADTFAAETALQLTPEQWARRMLDGAPPALKGFVRGVFRIFLRVRLAPVHSTDHVMGWEIHRSGPEEIVLGVESPIGLTARLVVLVPHGHVALATLVRFDRSSGHAVWKVLAPIHRRVAQHGVSHAAHRAAAAES